MKRTIACVLGILIASAASEVGAQNSDVAVARAALQKNRQVTVATNLSLSDGEARAFWPIYRQYRMEMARVGDRIIKLVKDLDSKYDAMTDADADTLLREYLSIQKSELDVRRKYVNDFRKAISPRKVMRLYQIENKINAQIRHELSTLIPLAK